LTALGCVIVFALPAIARQIPTLPDELFAPVGTVLTVQIQDHLSSNKNSVGDEFVAALKQPLVIDGWVVARAGQTVFGNVASANAAGRVKGTSDLAIELSEMVLVDGQRAAIRTRLVVTRGQESHAEDAAAIAGIGAVGAAIGAAVGGGKGALIGAGIGAGAATAGVLSTRGKAVEIYPESAVTFRLDAPLVVSTRRSQQAFVPVAPDDYEERTVRRAPPRADRETARSYEPYPPYPRVPRYPGPRVRTVPVVVFPPPVIIVGGRHPGRRW
jgi:hypothetical protein